MAKPIGTCSRMSAKSAREAERRRSASGLTADKRCDTSRQCDHEPAPAPRATGSRRPPHPERRHRNLQHAGRLMRPRELAGVDRELPGHRRRSPRRRASAASASSTRPRTALTEAPSADGDVAAFHRDRPAGSRQIATAMARPPRSRTPSIGRLASQRRRPSRSVMVASPISAIEAHDRERPSRVQRYALERRQHLFPPRSLSSSVVSAL